ncbi:MAG: hypothetical protein E7172_00910 [Firmicutes bacterium]|nr:hypothetical protein [Bacillota bacterium]
MKEFVSMFLIGISLSMDTFSLSLSISPFLKSEKYVNLIPFVVGLFHFLLPLLSSWVGFYILKYFNFTTNKILGIILIVLAFNMLVNYFKKNEIKLTLNLLGIMIFALSVSIDSLSVGFGINSLTKNPLVASLIFAGCSFSFTYLGLIIGKYCKKFLGGIANLIGIILLLILGVIHLF